MDIRRAVDSGMKHATSVFIGGGTPTMVPARELMSVLAEVPLAPLAEVTVECNPDDITPDMMRIYRQGGVNRVSIGVQSTVPHVLTSLGRTHNPANVANAVQIVKEAGFNSYNLDIIYGAAGESLDDWRTTVNDVIAFDPPHISAYGLTVEANTPLASQTHRHPDDDDQADKYEIVDTSLTRTGLINYEISNWSKPGHECAHNYLYWLQGNYDGFGCAAHAHKNGRRWWNVRTPERYIAMVRAGTAPLGGEETLDERTRDFERDSLSLRTSRGVPVEAFASLDEIAHLVAVRDGRVTLAPNGRLLANQVIVRLRSAD